MLCNGPILTPIGYLGSLLRITSSNATHKENKPRFASLLCLGTGWWIARSGIILHWSNTPNYTTGTKKRVDSCLQCADTAESTNATIKAYKINMFCNFLSTCAWCGHCILKATRDENWLFLFSGAFTRSEREPLFSSKLWFHSQKSLSSPPHPVAGRKNSRRLRVSESSFVNSLDNFGAKPSRDMEQVPQRQCLLRSRSHQVTHVTDTALHPKNRRASLIQARSQVKTSVHMSD